MHAPRSAQKEGLWGSEDEGLLTGCVRELRITPCGVACLRMPPPPDPTPTPLQVPIPFPAAVLIRPKALVVNLETVRMIICQNQCYVLSGGCLWRGGPAACRGWLVPAGAPL